METSRHILPILFYLCTSAIYTYQAASPPVPPEIAVASTNDRQITTELNGCDLTINISGVEKCSVKPDIHTSGIEPPSQEAINSRGKFRDENEEGDNGSKGDKGNAGLIGPQGTQGQEGNNGSKGENGNAGLTGPQGPQGQKGNNGSKGENGNAGLTGPQGPQGEKGNNGSKGENGNAGLTGPQGPQGEKGDNGTKGDKGDVGFMGPQGPQGQKGDNGITGDKGDVGLTGPQGTQGQKGDNGSKGDKGDVGPIGPQGPQGQKGDRGDKGNEGLKGLPGKDGSDGKMGDRGIPGLTGTSGNKGEKGEPGATVHSRGRGLRGPEAPDGSLGKKSNPANSCAQLDDGDSDSGLFYVNPGDKFLVHCNFQTKQTCLNIKYIGDNEVEQYLMEFDSKPFWTSWQGFDFTELYKLNAAQISYLLQSAKEVTETLRYYCKNTQVQRENKELQISSWDGSSIGLQPTDKIPMSYKIIDDNCKDASPAKLAYTDIQVSTKLITRLPAVDFYIQDIVEDGSNQKFLIQLRELCFTYSYSEEEE